MHMTHLLVLASLLAACSSSNSGSMSPDGHGSGDGSNTTLDPADCTKFAASLATASQTCGTPLPAGAQATFEDWCKKGIPNANLCGGNPAGGLACFASPDPGDWVCLAGQPYPACDGDLGSALGALCLTTLGDPNCAGSGLHCQFDVDCSGNAACNSVTHVCFSKTAYCVGLPCAFDVDCPDNEKCNSGEHACVHT
jgi:hypothetical protein